VQLHQTGALDQAIVEYKLGIAGYERMWEAWCNLAVIYMTQQNYTAALDAIVHADTIKPDDGLLLDYYGQILFALGKDEEALTKFRRSIVAEPKWKDSYLKMANVLKFDGHEDQATELLNKMPKDAQ
jgi:tetratricopeptide (TPR) repeat protein